jgi:hypothetical protein
MTVIGYDCFSGWEPEYSCEIVATNPQFCSRESCEQACRPQQVPGFEIIGQQNSCNGGYYSTPYARSPQECAQRCNADLSNCQYFMWDSHKGQENSEFVVDSNCIMFTDVPYACNEMITSYPATRGSVMYKKIDAPNPSGM